MLDSGAHSLALPTASACECPQKSAKVRQNDRDARRTKKRGRSFFGYKSQVNADAEHKLIRHYPVLKS